MENEVLYLKLKNEIMRKIFEGEYQDGQAIPSERKLSELYEMSRVTVRKTLSLLEKEGIIQRKTGKGNIVSLSSHSHKGRLDVIALVAPAQRRFFAEFINYFQKVADENGSLVVFIQQSEHESIKDTLFKLLQFNIHNVVIWLDYEVIRENYIKNLRGLGMNIVFFDITAPSPYADCVCLDNRDAMSILYEYTQNKNSNRVVYVSRVNTSPSSFSERNIAFQELDPGGMVWSFPFDFRDYLANKSDEFIIDHLCPTEKPGCIICSDGEVGIALTKAITKYKIKDVRLVSIDDFDECTELGMTVYKQPYDQFAKKIYECLEKQNNSRTIWKADVYRVKGTLIIRGHSEK